MPNIHRRHFLAATSTLTIAPQLAFAQVGYPSKPVKIIVPLPAGGAADTGARILGDALQRQLKQPVVIDNKPGGIFVIGMQAVTSAPADGYTLIALNSGMVAAQVTMKKIDLMKSLVPIANIGRTPTLLVVSAKSKLGTVQDLIAHAKEHPTKLNYGSVGLGTLEHLWGTVFAKNAGIEITHVPFKGMPDAITALIQGEIDFIPAVYSAASQYVKKGMLRSLGVISDQRVPLLGDVPTLKEQGVNVPPMEFWSGYGAPKGTPPTVIERLRSEIAAAVREPSVKEKFATLGNSVATTVEQADLEKRIKDDLAWMEPAAKAGNIRLE